MDIVALALQARKDAALVVDRHTNPSQKKASLALYGVLATCLELCERCGRDQTERSALEEMFNAQPKDGNRRYVERGSDIHTFVCRFVFTSTDRTNACRYAAALREASNSQIHSSNLFNFLKKNGGVRALYFRRPLSARIFKTRTLHLAEQLEIPRDEQFTVTLRWQDNNTFSVCRPIRGA